MVANIACDHYNDEETKPYLYSLKTCLQTCACDSHDSHGDQPQKLENIRGSVYDVSCMAYKSFSGSEQAQLFLKITDSKRNTKFFIAFKLLAAEILS